MNKVLLVGAHFDDAVLSAGQFIAGRPDCDVITVFGGFPEDLDQQTDYDRKTGFKDARDAVAIRRQEDNEALALLHANAIHWDYPDSQYKEPLNTELLYDDLKEALSGDYDFVIGPLGIGHPDHELISNMLVELMRETKKLYFWEDLPLRVLEPELVSLRLKQMPTMRLEFPGTGSMADKVRALWCYKSQIGTGILDPYIMYVPERFWRVK